DDVVVRLSRAGAAVEDHRLASVGGDDDILVVGNDADQFNRQDLDDVLDVHHVAPPHHVGANAIDNQLRLANLVSFQHPDDAVGVPHRGNLRGRDDDGVVGSGN